MPVPFCVNNGNILIWRMFIIEPTGEMTGEMVYNNTSPVILATIAPYVQRKL